jgi:hypothetical protein
MYDCVGRRVASFSVGFGVLGVVLVLLGSIVEVPYTARETFNNYPYNPPGIWADEVLTLRPHTYRYYALDLLNKNNSLIYVKVEKATNPLFFMIKSDYESGFDGKGTIIKKYISAREPPVSPFEYFWTPSGRGAWDFVFDNPYDTTTNVTVKIIDYRYNTEWQEKVTRYHPPLDTSFAYAGIVIIIAAIAPVAYNLYKTRKKSQKKHWWQDRVEAEKMREAEEAGRLE